MPTERDLSSDPRPGDRFRVKAVEIRVKDVRDGDVEFMIYKISDPTWLGEFRKTSRLIWAERVALAMSRGWLEMPEEYDATERLDSLRSGPSEEAGQDSAGEVAGEDPARDDGREGAGGSVEPAA